MKGLSLGLFGSDPVVEPALLAKLVNDSKRVRSFLARDQNSILPIFRPGESILCVAADPEMRTTTVVTTQRVFHVELGRLSGEIPGPQISQVEHRPFQGGFLAAVYRGESWLTARLSRENEVCAFVRSVEHELVTPQPRDIPRLYPDFYADILRGVGMSVTPHNMSELIIRIRGFFGGNAVGYFDKLGDSPARQKFEARIINGPRTEQDPDEMIDFLWQWNYRCRPALRHSVSDLGKELVGPGSFLRRCGDEIPAWE